MCYDVLKVDFISWQSHSFLMFSLQLAGIRHAYFRMAELPVFSGAVISLPRCTFLP